MDVRIITNGLGYTILNPRYEGNNKFKEHDRKRFISYPHHHLILLSPFNFYALILFLERRGCGVWGKVIKSYAGKHTINR
jgi:hypothetical protein